MNKPDRKQFLRETLRRRSLTDAERAELESSMSSGGQVEWNAELDEIMLTKLIEQFPPAPQLSSNFTAQVLQKIALEERAAERQRSARFSFWSRRWIMPLAATALVLFSSLFAYHGWKEHRSRIDLARNVNEMSASMTAADLKLMSDYEPIRRMSESSQPKADVELLALLQ